VPTRPFAPGERALLVDGKDRRYLVRLEAGASFHTHHGFVDHDELLGRAEGTFLKMQDGAKYLCVRPTLSDVVLKMPRGAQVIYPKDLGPILLLADIFPGARVLESGVGSGALSMTLLRAGAVVTGYELRQDFANNASKNVAGFLGDEVVDERYHVAVRDVYDGIDGEAAFDRVVLDLPEPWQVVGHAEGALVPGGILVSYVPSIIQVQRLRAALDVSGFGMCTTQEVLVRTWKVDGDAVRPDHRMVAHTGFLTAARLLRPPRQ
jgi:tRNA (adenine57-N1/adenine58-N1)-methyltransferase